MPDVADELLPGPPLQSVGRLWSGMIDVQHDLQGHESIRANLSRFVHHAHRATSQFAQDLVARMRMQRDAEAEPLDLRNR